MESTILSKNRPPADSAKGFADNKLSEQDTLSAWQACDENLKSELSYYDYIRLVAPLEIRPAKHIIEITHSHSAIRQELQQKVAPLLEKWLAATPFSFIIRNQAESQTIIQESLWDKCLAQLATELPEVQMNTWLRPLQAIESGDTLQLLANNLMSAEWVKHNLLERLQETLALIAGDDPPKILIDVIDRSPAERGLDTLELTDKQVSSGKQLSSGRQLASQNSTLQHRAPFSESSNLNDKFTFDAFVEGKSNQLAKAAASQIVDNPGGSYNPLFIYGGVGLGKTHLMHAVGNELKKNRPEAKVVYLHSERFVTEMVKALQSGTLDKFKQVYRSVDALLIDDIQFFAGKDRSQEEFFHTFNCLLEGDHQIILTCDRYPKEISGVEERLKSRFGWGLTVAIEPPELETRVAILMKKAEQSNVTLSHDAAFFLAHRLRSNVRELEGALKRVIATAQFTGKPLDITLMRESLKDLLALQDKQVSIDNIQRTTAEYYKIKVADLTSKRRNRSIARPRQMAMALAKELTSHSLPEIGDAFGGRDNTTVLHACRKISELRETNSDIKEDHKNLLRTLTA